MNLRPTGVITQRDWVFIFIWIAVIVLVLVGYVLVIQKPRKVKVENIESDISAAQSKLDNAKADVDRIEDLKKELAETEELITEFEEHLPIRKEVELVNFTQTLERYAAQEKVYLKKVVPEKWKAYSSYTRVPFAISMSAGYHEAAAFFNALERDDLFYQAMELNFSKQGSKRRGTVEFTLATYVLDKNAKAEKIEYVKPEFEEEEETKKGAPEKPRTVDDMGAVGTMGTLNPEEHKTSANPALTGLAAEQDRAKTYIRNKTMDAIQKVTIQR
ncbi:type 4a pilus biogenesis protein PilO [Candidatus Hydrogenedentota bacterium]